MFKYLLSILVFFSAEFALAGKHKISVPGKPDVYVPTFESDGKSLKVNGSFTPNGGIVGKTDGINPTVGKIGEQKTNERTTSLPSLVANTYFSIDSGNTSFNDGNEIGVTLTAGIWDIQGHAQILAGSGVVIRYFAAGIGTQKGNNATGMSITINQSEISSLLEAGSSATLTTPTWRVNITDTTTYYLKGIFLFSSGATASARGSLVAKRVI